MRQIVIKSYETRKSLIAPIALLLVGILLFTNPGGVVEFLSYILGGVFLALGIGKYLTDIKRENKTTGDSFYSLLLVALGILFIFATGTLEFLIRVILGVWLIINGVNTCLIGASMVKVNKKNVLPLIIGIILVVVGLYTILVSNLVLSTIGLILMVYGVLEIIDYICISKR